MKSESYTQTILRAEEGMRLTEVAEDTPIEERTLATIIALGVNDSADRYREITQAEADAYEAERERLRKEQEEAMRAADRHGPEELPSPDRGEEQTEAGEEAEL